MRIEARGIGIVGAGQLARMTIQAASALGIDAVVLAGGPDDAATQLAGRVLVGSPRDPGQLWALAARSEVVTFDHEHVDIELLANLERAGVAVRPGSAALSMGVDKALMRRTLAAAGIAVPAYAVLDPDPDDGVRPGGRLRRDPRLAAGAQGDARRLRRQGRVAGRQPGPGGGPLSGVPPSPASRCSSRTTSTSPSSWRSWWPADPTASSPSGPPSRPRRWRACAGRSSSRDGWTPALDARARALGEQVAVAVGATGVLAIEMFASGGELLVNELAARPHNSGHWTMDGSLTSQFENHVRAVFDRPLGATAAVAPAVASVNVLGGADGRAPVALLEAALAVEGAHVHLYGKSPAPGRKLGHVTVCGTDPAEVRDRAWRCAVALGTPVPAGLLVAP